VLTLAGIEFSKLVSLACFTSSETPRIRISCTIAPEGFNQHVTFSDCSQKHETNRISQVVKVAGEYGLIHDLGHFLFFFFSSLVHTTSRRHVLSSGKQDGMQKPLLVPTMLALGAATFVFFYHANPVATHLVDHLLTVRGFLLTLGLHHSERVHGKPKLRTCALGHTQGQG
jgi:hypothetical protein